MNEFCEYRAGNDPCHDHTGHTGDHWTYWGRPGAHIRPVMYWRGTEEWSHPRDAT